MLLSKFANEVLSRGASALLPQNLSSQWLLDIQKMVDDFLDGNFESENCSEVGDDVDPILSASVSEILSYQQAGVTEISPDELARKITIYAIQITVETIRRQSGIDMDPPSLENIFDSAYLARLKDIYPDLAQFYESVCLAEE